ncbi:Endo-1,6-beta-D-glucanase BGN16.3 [Lachnellula suecica]|uniref:Endo-1,6-beta-D-glucanase BGN16.3 n=1 Tax=Lachnellula suecica TaxID=602035 RepID=A0A8T9CEG9_9HELO|nr:Endo-1,6-beta-D-glucanase BGN16.3 [Lachnellula suecica]
MLPSATRAALGAQFILTLGFGLAASISNSNDTVDSTISTSSITVDLSTRYQTIDGFGFSGYFGPASTIEGLPAAQQKQTLDLLFNTTTGAGFTILRNGITVDVIQPKGPTLANGTATYAWDHSDSGQVWLSQQAQKYGVKRFFADSWSAPAFMKTNDNEDEGGYLCGVTDATCKTGDWRQAYADLVVQYLKDYQSEGINVTEVGFINEPEYEGSYDSMLSSGTQAADFIKVLHPTLQAAGLGQVGIVCCDGIGWPEQVQSTKELIAAGVEPLLTHITSHFYSGLPSGPMDTTLPVWQTEYALLKATYSDVWYKNGGGDETEGMTWANLIFQGIVQCNLSAYLHLWGVQASGAAGSLISAGFGGPVEASSLLWAYAQWSRHVRPAAVRVEATLTTTIPNVVSKRDLYVIYNSAFENPDGTVSVQIINNGAPDRPFTVGVDSMDVESAQAWLTDSSHIGIFAVNGMALSKSGILSLTVPTQSMVTVLFTPASKA